MPKLAACGASFIEINGNDEIVFTTTEDEGSTATPAHSRLLFGSMVVSPSGRKRSVYIVRIEHLADALRSLAPKGIELEHIFDF